MYSTGQSHRAGIDRALLYMVNNLSRKRIKGCVVSCKGPFIFYEGGGAGGIWEAPFKNRMTPPQLTNFFTWPPPYSGHFLG